MKQNEKADTLTALADRCQVMFPVSQCLAETAKDAKDDAELSKAASLGPWIWLAGRTEPPGVAGPVLRLT